MNFNTLFKKERLYQYIKIKNEASKKLKAKSKIRN